MSGLQLRRLYGRLLRLLALLSAGVIAAMLVGVTADVLLRNLFVSGILGIVEYTEFGLYLSGILAAPWLLHTGQHIKADLVTQFASAPVTRVADVLTDVLGLAVSLVVGWYALQATIESRAAGSVVRRTVDIPEWLLIAPLGIIMMLLAGEFMIRLASAAGSARVEGDRADA